MSATAETGGKREIQIGAALASFCFMAFGGGLAWGFGGMLFSAGLGLMMALLADEIRSASKIDR